MNPALSITVFAAEDEARQNLCARLDATELYAVGESVCEALELPHSVQNQRPDVLVVDLGKDPDSILDALESLPAPRPALLFIGPQGDSQLLLRSMRLGGREFFSGALCDGALEAACQRLQAELAPRSADHTGRTLAVIGAKCGVGSSVVACQLAASLQASGGRTAIVDLSRPFGDVALYLDVRPRYTLADAAGDAEILDVTYIKTLLHRHSSGIQLLASPTHAESRELIKAHHIERILRLLKQEVDWIVMDVPRVWDDVTLRTLDFSDLVLLITAQDVPTLNHTQKVLALLEQLEIPKDRIQLVANRVSRKDLVSERDLSDFLGRGPDALIPNDYTTISDMLNCGGTLSQRAPKSAVGASYRKLAAQVHGWCGCEMPADPKKSGLAARFGLSSWRKNGAT